jgi:hypothetical protein
MSRQAEGRAKPLMTKKSPGIYCRRCYNFSTDVKKRETPYKIWGAVHKLDNGYA